MIDRSTSMQATKATALGRGALDSFWRDQSGAMSYIGVSGALVMMVFGGIGIDMMHAELKRTKLQNTLDRAVLAAAALDNDLDPTLVVNSYFGAAGMPDALQSVAIDQINVGGVISSRAVQAEGYQQMASNFMSLIGVNTLQAQGNAAAANAINNVEVSVVLDISGSMSGTKLTQLQHAAKNFVDTMLGDGDSTVTMSIVPYSATVNMGDTMPDYFNLENLHDISHCGTFPTESFQTTSLAANMVIEQIGHFDPISTSQTPGEANYPWCHYGNTAAILPLSSDPEALKARIDTFVAWGNTAIDLGMKWGTTLLDPSIRPNVDQMIVDGHVGAAAAGRPAAMDAPDTLKFIVLMTDGQNTTQFDLPRELKTGEVMTGIWHSDNGTPDQIWDDKFSVRVVDNPGTDNDVYYWTRFMMNPNQRYQTTIDRIDHPVHPARELTYNELYGLFGTQGAANLLYLQPYYDGYDVAALYNRTIQPYVPTVNYVQADTNLSNICAQAKSKGIVVYTIGVEAPPAGLAAMQDCASSAAHYFDVTGNELDATFSAIARTLTKLRLTQ